MWPKGRLPHAITVGTEILVYGATGLPEVRPCDLWITNCPLYRRAILFVVI